MSSARSQPRSTQRVSNINRSSALVSGDSLDKQRIKALQQAVAAVAEAQGLPEGLLCARRHLEALLEGRGWPPALAGWRRELDTIAAWRTQPMMQGLGRLARELAAMEKTDEPTALDKILAVLREHAPQYYENVEQA